MKISRILFIVMMLVAVSLVGCGGSSDSDNLVVDRGNGGLVNVTGKVANVSDRANVSFYTVEAAMKNGLLESSSVRANVNQKGVYYTNTDKDGNYSIAVPENTYYIIANEGDRMAVSGKQSFVGRAAYGTVDDIVLTKTMDMKGTLTSSKVSVASIPVFIENTPFMCVSDANGTFTFNKIPQLSGADEYKFVSYICIEGIRYSGSASVTKDNQTSVRPVINLLEDSTMASKTVAGHVYYSGSTTPVADHNVMVILPSGLVYSARTDSNGQYSVAMNTDETVADVTANMITFVSANLDTDSDVILYVDEASGNNHGTLLINEACTGSSVFGEMTMNTLVLLAKKGTTYEKYHESMIGTPVSNYAVSNLPAGDYCYAIFGEIAIANSPMFGCLFSNDFTITAGKETSVTAENSLEFVRPTIMVKEDNYYAVNILPKTFNGDNADACVSVVVRASDENNSITDLTHTMTTVDGIDAGRIDFTNIIQTGEYRVWVEVKLNVNGYEKTFTSDKYPYVKAVTGDNSVEPEPATGM